MAVPSNRTEFKAQILRALGAPVISLNLDDTQVEDGIDDALSFWRDYHYDAQDKTYIAHILTQEEVDSKEIVLDPSISAVTRIFKFVGDANQGTSDSIFNVDYQLRLNDLWDLTSVNLSGYVIARQYISQIDDILNVDFLLRFREYEGVLRLDTNKERLYVGQYIIIEAYQYLDENTTRIWSNRVLRQLATAYVRRRWANNMLKFKNQQLAGGVTLNVDSIMEEARLEIEKLEANFIQKYSAIDESFLY